MSGFRACRANALAATSAVVVIAGLLAACGSTSVDVDAASSAPSAASEAGSPAAPAPAQPEPAPSVGEGPPQVLFAGDSIMRELSAGLGAALEGPTTSAYVAMPYVLGNEASLAEWAQRVAQDPPDLVVLLVGTWEGLTVAQRFREPGFDVVYAEEVRPFVELLTDAGASLLWLGYPPLELAEETEQLQAFNRVWSTLPGRFPDVRYLDAGAAVAPTGSFQLTVPLPDGGVALARQSDGRHLCPDGVVLMARPVVAEVAGQLGVEPVAGWESAPWRVDPARFEHPELCPGDF